VLATGSGASGKLVPLLLYQGPTRTRIGLRTLALILTLVAWTGWLREDVHVSARYHPARHLRAILRLISADLASGGITDGKLVSP
jgi:hypothetical protein